MVDTSMKNEYFLKIAPDLSVLDIAEKYMLENNKNGEHQLFYYKEKTSNNNDSINDCTFRRGLFKIKGISNPISVSTDGITESIKFENGSDLIVIAINNQEHIKLNVPIGFTIIGVAF